MPPPPTLSPAPPLLTISMSTPNRVNVNRLVVMPAEELAAYERHLKSFVEEYLPQGATETHLVRTLASITWRLHRVAALENKLPPDSFKAFSTLSTYSERLFRQLERTLAQLGITIQRRNQKALGSFRKNAKPS